MSYLHSSFDPYYSCEDRMDATSFASGGYWDAETLSPLFGSEVQHLAPFTEDNDTVPAYLQANGTQWPELGWDAANAAPTVTSYQIPCAPQQPQLLQPQSQQQCQTEKEQMFVRYDDYGHYTATLYPQFEIDEESYRLFLFDDEKCHPPPSQYIDTIPSAPQIDPAIIERENNEEEEEEEEEEEQSVPQLLHHPEWPGGQYGHKVLILSDKRAVTFKIDLPPFVRTRKITLKVSVEIFKDSTLEIETTEKLDTLIANQASIEENKQKSLKKIFPAPKQGKETRIAFQANQLLVNLWPKSYRLEVHRYRFDVTISDTKQTFSLTSYPTTTYTHITDQVHRLFKRLIPYIFKDDQEISKQALVQLSPFLQALNNVKGYKEAAFSNFPCPDVNKASWTGKDLAQVVDWFVMACKILETYDDYYSHGYIHGPLSVTDTQRILEGRSAGHFLIRIGLDGMVISYLDELLRLQHIHLPHIHPQFLELMLGYPQMQTLVLSPKAKGSDTVSKCVLLALLAQESPLLPGYTLPYYRGELSDSVAFLGLKRKLPTDSSTKDSASPKKKKQGKKNSKKGSPPTPKKQKKTPTKRGKRGDRN